MGSLFGNYVGIYSEFKHWPYLWSVLMVDLNKFNVKMWFFLCCVDFFNVPFTVKWLNENQPHRCELVLDFVSIKTRKVLFFLLSCYQAGLCILQVNKSFVFDFGSISPSLLLCLCVLILESICHFLYVKLCSSKLWIGIKFVGFLRGLILISILDCYKE